MENRHTTRAGSPKQPPLSRSAFTFRNGVRLRSRRDPGGSALAVCARLTEAIGRMEQVEDIYEAALDALADGLNVQRASVLLFDADGQLRFKAWRGLSESYRQTVEGHTAWPRHARGVQPIVVSDVRDDPSLAPYLPAIQGEQIAAMAFIPLEGAGGVLGKFMLYYGDRHELAEGELQLAQVIAAQIAFGVERAQSHQALVAKDERLGFALEAANMGTWDWDLVFNALRWSENMERIHGLAAGTFDGTFASYQREMHPEDRERVEASIRRALEGNGPHDVEYRIVAPDGTVHWVEGKGRVEAGPDGQPERMTGVCMNVTRRKEAELARVEALEQSARVSQRLAEIVASSDDAIVSKDLRGVITSWNRGAERMFGYAEREAVGQSITLIVPADRRAEEDQVLASIRSGEPVEMETVRRHRDGSDVDVSVKVSPVRDARGAIVGASKIARNIGARKRDEAERAELHRRLTLLVEASASLLNSPETEAVQAATVALARRLLDADGYALWVSDPEVPRWRVAKSDGVSVEFTNRVITSVPRASAAACADVRDTARRSRGGGRAAGS